MEERIQQVLRFCNERVLDIGCGENELIRRYRALGFLGVGIDAHQWNGVDVICDATRLAFKNDEFDTVCFVGSLNHIPNRNIAIQEQRRVLRKNGRVIVTMLDPFIGILCHKLSIKDADRDERGMKKGEKYGLSVDLILKMFYEMDFKLEVHKTFVYGLNHLFVFKKEDHKI